MQWNACLCKGEGSLVNNALFYLMPEWVYVLAELNQKTIVHIYTKGWGELSPGEIMINLYFWHFYLNTIMVRYVYCFNTVYYILY